MTSSQSLHLALCLQQSAVPFLSQPGAGASPPTLPIALAGSAAADGGDEGAAAYHQLVVLRTSLHVLTTLLHLLKHAAAHLSTREASRLAHALSPVTLCSALCHGYLQPRAGCAYGCQVFALAVLQQLLAVLAAETDLMQPPEDDKDDHRVNKRAPRDEIYHSLQVCTRFILVLYH
jgi:hypothetical protein